MYRNKGWDSKSRNPETDAFASLKKIIKEEEKEQR